MYTRPRYSVCSCLLCAIFLAGFTLASIFPPPVRADEIVSVTVSDLSFTGNSVCGPSGKDPCVETFSGSFLWDNTTDTAVPNSGTAVTTGPLDTFSLDSAQLFPGSNLFVLQAIWDNSDKSAGVDLNIFLPDNSVAPGNYPIMRPTGSYVGLSEALLLTATGTVAAADFRTGNGGPLSEQGTTGVSAVPEPSSLALLVAGLLGLGLLRRFVRTDLRIGIHRI